MTDTNKSREDWANGCRRLFLRGCKAVKNVEQTKCPLVNVEIWVPYMHSTSRNDDLADVVDYSIMRDALLRADSSTTGRFISTALDDLAKWPVLRARVEVNDAEGGSLVGEGERMTRQ